MHIFTHRFIKDLIISFFFLLFVYLITHNSIVQPKPKETNGLWHIEKLQHPLLFGLVGHNYLVLKDPNENIVSEFHGLATDALNSGWKHIGSSRTDLLKVWEFDGPRNYLAEKKYPGVIVSEGSEAEMRIFWTKARYCKDYINQRVIHYPLLGVSFNNETVNSNSVAYTLLMCMGIDSKHLGFLTPGDKVNLIR